MCTTPTPVSSASRRQGKEICGNTQKPTFCPGSFASPEAVAHIYDPEICHVLAAYRLEQEFQRQGLKLSRQTMANWILQDSGHLAAACV